MAQAALCEMANSNLDEAEKLLRRVDDRFGKVQKDIRLGLWCRLELARENPSEALAILDKMIDRDSKSYKTIRYRALTQLLRTDRLADSDRERYEQEVEELKWSETDVKNIDLPELESFVKRW